MESKLRVYTTFVYSSNFALNKFLQNIRRFFELIQNCSDII